MRIQHTYLQKHFSFKPIGFGDYDDDKNAILNAHRVHIYNLNLKRQLI